MARRAIPVTLRPDGTISSAEGWTSAGELLELIRRPAWMADAACKEHPELDWFPTRANAARVVPAVKAVCAGCLVRDECAAYAEEHKERFGVWGGGTRDDRRLIRSAGAPAA